MRNCITLLSLLALVFAGFLIRTSTAESGPLKPQSNPYSLHFFDIHTGNRLEIIYRNRAGYNQDALNQLNSYLRDRRTGQEHR